MTPHRTYDVLIVGLGPVGAVLAALLGQQGRSVLAIDQQREIYPLPRAAHLDHEIMRILQSIHVIEAIEPHIRTAPDYEFRSASGEALMRIEREGEMGVSGWATGFNFYQPGIERAVRDRLSQLDNVRTEFGVSFIGLATGRDELVTANLATEDGDVTVSARFVVGCDGAWSPVREALGIELDDYQFDEPWLVLDSIVEDESGFPALNLQLCDPDRPTTFVHMGPGRLRWEFMLRPGEDAAAMRQPENVDRLLRDWRTMGSISVERSAVYRFHGLVARQWRQGRVLLAGDAAHQMPPFMGQGLCSGLRDAANIAWKIDHVLDGASLTLLDSYQGERDPHVRHVIERAIEMGRVVCTLDPYAAAARDAEMLANPRIGKPVAFPPISGATLAGSPDAGTIFPQPVDDAEGRLDDLLGAGAWLLHGSAQSSSVNGAFRSVAVKSLPPHIGGKVAQWLADREVEAVLVRPDRYVFGTGAAEVLADAWHAHLGKGARPA